MEAAFAWIGEIAAWIAAWFPTWSQIDRNELQIKHKGWWRRRLVVQQPGCRIHWPAFSQIEGPFKVVPQPLTTSTINAMDKEGNTVAARGFARWRVTDVVKFAVDNDGTAEMLDDLLCAAIREVIITKTINEIQGNSRKTTDNALLREVRELTEDLGVEVLMVRLTTFTKTRVLSMLGDEAPTVVEDEDEDE